MISQISAPVLKRRVETQISGPATNGNYKKLGKQFGHTSPRADDAPSKQLEPPSNLEPQLFEILVSSRNKIAPLPFVHEKVCL